MVAMEKMEDRLRTGLPRLRASMIFWYFSAVVAVCDDFVCTYFKVLEADEN